MSDQVTDEDVAAYQAASRKKNIGFKRQDEIDLPYTLKATDSVASKDSSEAADYNRLQRTTNSSAWQRKCLILQRTARGIPAVNPTAFAASMMVPKSERIYKVSDWKRGMVGFSYDPTDPDTAGHIFYVMGRMKNDLLLTSSNDVKEAGHVDVVPVNFYHDVWRHELQFAATNLNGYEFSDFNKEPKPRHNFNTLGDRYQDAIDTLKKIRRDKSERDNTDLVVRLLTRDIDRMERHFERLSA